MRPMSGFVLVVAALLTSPALAGAVAGEMAVDVALTRYLLVVGVCWVLITIAAEWFWSEPPATARATPAQASETEDSVDPLTP